MSAEVKGKANRPVRESDDRYDIDYFEARLLRDATPLESGRMEVAAMVPRLCEDRQRLGQYKPIETDMLVLVRTFALHQVLEEIPVELSHRIDKLGRVLFREIVVAL